MTATKQSSAYMEFNGSESRMQEDGEASTRLHVVPTRRRRRLQPGVVGIAVIAAFAAICILIGNMYLTQLTAKLSAQTEELDRLAAESVSLATKQESGLNLQDLETYAAEQLGMVKMDNAQIEYVELVNPESITTRTNALTLDALLAGLAHSFSAALEYIS